ncbi:hypothetical protein PK98_14710 [Croceibacterium mercuriale]|uniref:Polysaccharide biosynthesis protein C-terminal domain-containing protein n=1 Tax=Croceibacterium mercuriale TaxID=1572751 RepID=A0A0B2BWB2_9SPHN|nr:hypothetical protein PK98_14710 [Croceibacterium mercuriale]
MSLGIGSGLFDKVVVALVQLIMVPLLSNAWGLHLYGTWAMMITIPSMLVLSDFGIVSSAWARMTMFISRGEMGEARSVLHTAWLSASLSCCVVIVVTVATSMLLSDEMITGGEQMNAFQTRIIIVLLALYGLGVIMFRLNTAIFRAAGNFTLATWCSTASFTLENMALLACVLSGGRPLAAAITLLIARLVAIGFVFWLSHRRFREVSPGFSHASRLQWREMWRPALSSSLLGFGSLAFLQTSVLALGFVAGSAAVPAFMAVRTLSRVGLQVAMMIANPAAQEFAQEMSLGHSFRAGRYFGLVGATSIIMGLGMAIGLTVLGLPFIDLWTGGAIDVSFLLIVFMATSSAAAVLWNALAALISALNRQGSIAPINFVVCVVGVAVILLLGDRIGADAAGLAYAVTDAVTVFSLALFVRRSWWRDAEFRRGTYAALSQLRAPRSALNALRRGI